MGHHKAVRRGMPCWVLIASSQCCLQGKRGIPLGLRNHNGGIGFDCPGGADEPAQMIQRACNCSRAGISWCRESQECAQQFSRCSPPGVLKTVSGFRADDGQLLPTSVVHQE